MFKKITCILLAVVMLSLPLALPVSADGFFTDVPNDHWAARYIYATRSLNIINGYPDGTFKPEEKVKVGEFIKMAAMAYYPNYKYKAPAPDEPDGNHWSKPYVLLVDGKLLNAKDYYDSRMDDVITRMEATRIVTYLYMFSNYNDDTKNHLDETEEYIKNLKDENLITDERDRNCINTCIKAGLINGFDDGTFRPFDGLTRAQAAKIIYLALRN